MIRFDPLDRRAMLARTLTLVGAGTVAGLNPMALAKAAAGPQRFLPAADFTLLEVVCDTIVPRTATPGAVDAGVPATVDALLRDWASTEHRTQLREALAVIDRKAREQKAKPFALLAAEDRHALLAAHDVEALKVVPGPAAHAATDMRAGPPTADPGYAKLKELIVLSYYLSEPALTQELAYVHAPGAWKPSIPVTPETRPYAGEAF